MFNSLITNPDTYTLNLNYKDNSIDFSDTSTNPLSSYKPHSDDSDMNTTDRSIITHNPTKSISPKDKHIIPTSKPVCRKLNFYEDDHDIDMSTKDSVDDSASSNNLLFIRKRSSTNFSFFKHKFDEDYVIIKTLSLGEQGTVYLCVKTKDKQVYVVKVTNEFTSKEDYITMYDFEQCLRNNYSFIFSRFILDYKDFWIESECEITSHISSHKRTSNNKNLYIVTEHCSNGNLLSYKQRLMHFNFNFTSTFYYDIIFEMLCAVMFIHKMGYIHFDIKPTNFLVDIYGNIKLTDFCLSRTEESIHHNAGDLIREGDSVYISPELFDRKDEVSYKTDVFSLGLAILEVLTSVTLPKNGEMWIAIRNKEVPKMYMEGIVHDRDVFESLIRDMTKVDWRERPTVEEVLMNEKYGELYERYKKLIGGEFKKEFVPGEWKEFMEGMDYDFKEVDNLNMCFAKRSDSTKFVN